MTIKAGIWRLMTHGGRMQLLQLAAERTKRRWTTKKTTAATVAQ